MRTSPLLVKAVLLGAVLTAAAPAVTTSAAPSPTPSRTYTVGEIAPPGLADLPSCGVGYGLVVIDRDLAVLIAGSGNYVNEILQRGQTVKDFRGGTLTFNRDGQSITYNDYEHQGGARVTEVCKPRT